MKKVLIFTYYWPPAGGVAVQRFLKFSKYLPEFGWQPIIVTVKNGSYPFTDKSLLQQVSDTTQVYRTDTFEPFEFYNLLQGKKGKSLPTVSVGGQQKQSWFQKISEYIRANFFIPDARKGWVKYAVAEAEKIIAKEKIDTIITTGPPHSTHLIGLQLKKEFGLKWVADFRDPWTNNLMNEFLPRTTSTIQKDLGLENEVLNHADAISVISEGMKDEFTDRAKQVAVIYNGFDADDFNVSPKLSAPYFTLRHVGNLIVSMNVPALWQAIAELMREQTGFKEKFRLEIIGGIHPSVQESFRQAHIESNVIFTGHVPHSEAIAYMKGASCLLFLVSDVKKSELLMSGKIFEYIAAKRNILPIGPVNGNAAQLLKRCQRDEMIDFADKEKVKRALLNHFNNWQKTQTVFEYSGQEHLLYSRQHQCSALAQLLNQL